MTTATADQQQTRQTSPVVRVDSGQIKAKLSMLARNTRCVLRHLFGFNHQDERFVDLLSSPVFAAAIAVLALSLGTLVSVFGGDMRNAMQLATQVRLFQQSTYLPLHLTTLIFWLNLLLWTRLLYLRLLVEHTLRDARIRKLDSHVIELRGAIFRAYNPAVINAYKDQFEQTLAGMREAVILSQGGNPDTRGQIAEAQVQVILRAILTLVAEFSFSKAAEFEVNVMMFAEQSLDGFPETLRKALVFFDEGRDITKLQGLLYTTRELMYHGTPEPWIPAISLPVPHAEEANGVKLVLPGAPHAFITGAMNVYEDTRNLHRDYPDLDAAVRRDMRVYFAEGGLGAGVRSFASLRIGSEPRLGVLNISRTRENVLGPERQYYTTLHALVTPYLYLLEEVLRDYAPHTRRPGGTTFAEPTQPMPTQGMEETLSAG